MTISSKQHWNRQKSQVPIKKRIRDESFEREQKNLYVETDRYPIQFYQVCTSEEFHLTEVYPFRHSRNRYFNKGSTKGAIQQICKSIRFFQIIALINTDTLWVVYSVINKVCIIW